MTALAHAYPWDLIGDPAAAGRMRDLGVNAVALAAAYHSVRAATPLHPRHRLIDARHAALYLPVRETSWRASKLAPVQPDWMADDSSYGRAAVALKDAGLPVYAWIVLTHASRLGWAHPDLCVRNAFGDRYPYALCPSQPDVADYCSTLVREVVQQGDPDGVVLEACGPLGFAHGSHHEKTESAEWSALQQQLLSLCFCDGCLARYVAAQVDPDALRARVRAAIDGPPASMEAALAGDFAPVAGVRASVAGELRKRLVGEIRTLAPEIRIVLHGSADPWVTGAFPTIAGGLMAQVDTLTVNCWQGPERGTEALAAARALAPDARLAAYVLALAPRPGGADALATELNAYASAGADEFHLYHAGLASAARLDAMRDALAQVREQ